MNSGPEISAPAADGSVTVAGVRLTHPDRVLYPEQGITKLALARYYVAIGDWILPQVRDRPLSLVRCPAGEGGTCFYQKHAGAGIPDAIGTVEIAESAATRTYMVIENLAGLVATAQIGVLELHPWGSTVAKLETPDRIIFDLDPDIGLPWERVTGAAITMREALLGLGLESFAKTTGGKGLHVVVPIAPRLGWDRVREFSRKLAERFVAADPDHFTVNSAKRARPGRIFIDYLRNSRGATAIAAYSPRARPGAPVAMPLSWDEVESGVRPDRFTIATVPQLLAGLAADPWAGMRGMRQTIGARAQREIGM
jgi:bifunctional non-homologous end joining protein LigD